MSTWILSLVFGAIGGFGGGYAAWKLKVAVDNATDLASGAMQAVKLLASDIDHVDERFDGVYAELERHEKTFAKSRKSRSSEKATTAPKTGASSGVNYYTNSEAS